MLSVKNNILGVSPSDPLILDWTVEEEIMVLTYQEVNKLFMGTHLGRTIILETYCTCTIRESSTYIRSSFFSGSSISQLYKLLGYIALGLTLPPRINILRVNSSGRRLIRVVK